MNRIRVFVAIAAVVVVGGSIAAFAVTARSNGDPGIPIVAAEESTTSTTAHEEPSSTTTVPSEPHETTTSTTSTTETHEPTTSTTEAHHEPATTTSTTEFHEPTTTVPSTTTTTEARPAPTGTLHIACATPAPDGGPSSVVCEWNDPPPHTTRWVLMRETVGPSQQLWETDDLSVRRHVDDSAQAGVSYAYRISAYNGDTLIATSNSVRLVAGGEG